MLKKTFFMACTMTAWMLASAAIPSTNAQTSASVSVTLPEFPVTVNDSAVDNKHSRYLLLVHKDITYFPMTYHYTTSLGLSPHCNLTDGLAISKHSSNGY